MSFAFTGRHRSIHYYSRRCPGLWFLGFSVRTLILFFFYKLNLPTYLSINILLQNYLLVKHTNSNFLKECCS